MLGAFKHGIYLNLILSSYKGETIVAMLQLRRWGLKHFAFPRSRIWA